MKKNIVVRILAIICSMILLFTGIGCSNKEEIEKKPTNGKHEIIVTETDKDFVVNGKTDYVVVCPEKSSSFEITAKNEFIKLFEEATDISIKSIADTGLNFDQTKKYISIGNTSLLKTANIEINKKEITDSGVRIVTKGNTVFLSGGDRDGVIYSVYTFMEQMFNYDTFYMDCMVIDKNVQNIKLMDFDITDVPDFSLRQNNYGVYGQFPEFAKRMRVNYMANDLFPIFRDYNDVGSYSKTTHNTDTILNRDRLGGEHPKWFSDAGNQLCYTAHGDKEEYNLMVEETVNKCLNSLQFFLEKDYPLYTTFGIMMEDNSQGCSCQTCAEEALHYNGAASGSVVIFLNNVAKLFVEKYTALKNENPDDLKYSRNPEDFRFIMFAYLCYVAAPAKLNESTKKMEPIDEKVICADNVEVRLALTNLYTWYSIHAEENTVGKATVEGWGSLCKNLHLWTYSANFHMHMYPFQDLTFINSETYSFLAENCKLGFYNQSVWNTRDTLPSWYALNMYVDSKLQWDTSLDVNVLKDKWFKAMFKYDETISIMKEVYEETMLRSRVVFLEILTQDKNFMGGYPNNQSCYPYQLLNKWIGKYDLALESIEKYKNDADYDMVYDHIETQALSPLFMMIELHSVKLSVNQKEEYVDRLLSDVKRMNLYKMVLNEAGASFYDWVLQQKGM